MPERPSLRRVLCFGDSNTWGYMPGGRRLPVARHWYGVMASLLRGWADVIGDGVNGRTTNLGDPLRTQVNGAGMLPWALERHAPLDLIVLMLGTNDLQAQYDRGAGQVARGLEELVLIVHGSGGGRAGGAPRLLLLVPPAIDRPCAGLDEVFIGAEAKSRRLPAAVRDLGRRQGCEVLDISGAVSGHAGDGIHLDARDHRILGRMVAARVWGILSTGMTH